MKFTKTLFLISLCNFAFSQDVQFTAVTSSTSCSGTLIEFDVEYIPSETSVTEFDFNDGILPSGWTSSPYTVGQPCDPGQGDTPSNTNYFWATTLQSGGDNNGLRFVETSSVDVSQGGSLEFFIRYGADDPSPGCEDGERPSEEVWLQYSVNEGASWVTFFDDWDTDRNKLSPWYSWYDNDIDIPVEAWSRSTKFRWYQPDNDGNLWDNWGLEDVIVNAIPPPANSWNFDFGNGETGSSNTAANTLTFTKLYPVSNTDKIYSVTISTTLTDGSIVGISNTVLVEASDTISPSVILPPDLTVPTDTDSCTTILLSTGTVTATDNCAISSIENDNPNLLFLLGENILTWTITDSASNTTVMTQKITVVDQQAPVLVVPPDIISPNCTVTIGTASATDNCGGLVPRNNAPATFSLGITAVTWQVTDAAGNTVSATQLVTVSDTTAPLNTAPADITTTTDANSCVATGIALGLPTSSDNCTVATVTNDAPASFPTGTTTITWTVVDTAGNQTLSYQRVTVTDTTPPVIVAPPDLVSDSCAIILGTPTISDNCNVTFSNDAPSSFSTGVTVITWTASDSFGNTVTATQLVSFSDTTTPTILLQDETITINADTGSCFASGVDLGSVITNDDCGISSITNNAPLQFPIGTTQVIHTVTDIFGNSNSSMQNVTVLDTEIPLIQANDLVLTLNSDGEVEIPFDAIDNGSTDNCTISTYNIVSKDTENIFTDETPIPLAQEEFQNSDLTCAIISLNGLGVTENGNIILPSLRYGNIISLTTDYQDYDSQQNKFDVVDIETERVITFRITIPDNFTNSIEEYIECNATAIQPIFGSTGKSSLLTETSNTKIKTLNSKKIVLNCGNLGPQQIIYSVTDSSGNTASTTVNITITDDLNVCSLSSGSSGSGGSVGSIVDSDGDGVEDSLDAFPADPTEWTDTDNDGLGNNSDTDDDGDGYLDTIEVDAGSNPLDRSSIPLDTDSDGIINLLDEDDDNDGFTDVLEIEVGTDPLDVSSFPLDTDNDLELDFYDLDDDNDGQSDLIELECGSDPLNNLSRATDTDFDGIPNCLDIDDDNDAFLDEVEIAEGTDPLNVNEYPSLDSDGDGIPYSLSSSQSFNDNCPDVPNPNQLDTDEDGFGDLCDNCVTVENQDQLDSDQDGYGDVCDVCPDDFNPEQEDYDRDLIGDLCDPDDDNDGQTDDEEIACGSDPKDETSRSPDFDGDGILDCFDLDNDNDGIEDSMDPNPTSFDEILISQFISDNNDGINDTWELIKIESYSNSQIYIYTRSGVLIYNKRNYLNSWPADSDSNLIPEGSYYYRIDLDGNDTIDFEGWLYLTR